MKDYSYQDSLITRTYQHIISDKICLLAACPGAGKTNMALRIAQKYLKDFPKARILVLAHGQKILRTQFYQRAIGMGITCIQELKEREIKITERITVTLPQAIIRKVDLFNFDLLIVDEAHHYYQGQMVQDIIKATKIKHQLLLTGTPSVFIGKVPIVSITLSELVHKKILIDPSIKMVSAGIAISKEDYHRDFELKSKKILQADILKILEKIELDPQSKTMIICHSQSNAQDVYTYLTKLKYKATLSISARGVYDGTDNFEDFKNNTNFIIVVRRGILGFDYPDLCSVIDLTMSLNINRMFQQVCRVVRNSNNKKKYIKVFPSPMHHENMLAMYSVIGLAYPESYLRPHVEKQIMAPRLGGGIRYMEDLSFSDYELYIHDTVELSFNREYHPHNNAEEVMAKINKYSSYFDFKKDNRRDYRYAILHFPEVIRNAFPDSPAIKKEWDLFSANQEMLKHSQKCKFKDASSSAYKLMLREGRELFDKHFSRFRDPRSIDAKLYGLLIEA